MGFPVRRGDGEITDEEEEWRNEGVGRRLAPQITDYIREREREMMEQDRSDEMDEALSDLDGTWSQLETRESVGRPRQKREWERESHPLARQDPMILPDVSLLEKIGKNWFLNDQIPRPDVGRGYGGVVLYTTSAASYIILHPRGFIYNTHPTYSVYTGGGGVVLYMKLRGWILKTPKET